LDETNSHRGASAASGLFIEDETKVKNAQQDALGKNRRLIGSEVGPYLIQDKKPAIESKGAARFSATTGNPLNMIDTQIRDEKSIEGGVFNFYDMNDVSSVRSKSLNPNDMRSPVNNDLAYYHSSRAHINGQ
jgi:hypothetical protein